MRNLIILLLTFVTAEMAAQTVTHGPIIGGVTNSSVQLFLRTSDTATVELQFSSDQFSNVDLSLTKFISSSNDFSRIFEITGLAPDTRYQVRVMIQGSPSGNISTFKSFPLEGTAGHYKLLFGSCIYELLDTDSSLFVQMLTEDANVFTPTGDWGYPDKDNGSTDLYLSNPPTSWAVDYDKVRDSYKDRYGSPNSGFFYRSIVMDYTHDDHDYLNDNTGKDHANIFDINPFGGNFGEPITVSQPPAARLNLLKGYSDLFPHYPLVDSTEGIFHNYTLGNVELFVLDTRSTRSSQHAALNEVGGEWVQQEPVGHSILGQVQMNWLLNGLQSSTADWKIIVSSVTFNIGYRAVMDSLLEIGGNSSPILGADISGFQISTGILGAGILSDLWVGFPTDQDQLLNHITSNNIKNVFLVSGDAHSAALDDGTNSGIPELMAANLKKANSEDPRILSEFIGYSLWNKGASGMGNQNLNNTYGKIEVFGNDSLRMSAVDANGTEVCGHTFYHEMPTGTEEINSEEEQKLFSVYPNPASEVIIVKSNRNNTTLPMKLTLLNSDGKQVLEIPFQSSKAISVNNWSSGIYVYYIADEKGRILENGKVNITSKK